MYAYLAPKPKKISDEKVKKQWKWIKKNNVNRGENTFVVMTNDRAVYDAFILWQNVEEVPETINNQGDYT